MENIIIVTQKEKNKATLQYKNFIIDAFIGKKGTTTEKQEGDKKTPLGLFRLGHCFGTHNKNEINKKLNYFEITDTQYWVDDSSSIYYNQLVDITKTNRNWNSAEHLSDYPDQYEYAIEILSNPQNVPNKGSAIFLHCSLNHPTSGCIAIKRNDMKLLLDLIDENTEILIRKMS